MEDTAKGISRKQDVIDDWLAQISKSGEVVAEWTGQVVGNGRGGDGDFLDLAAMDALVVAIRDGTDREVVAELLLLEGEVLDGEICTGLQLQKETGGLGHAVLCAKNFVGNEPFAVLYGDDVIISDNPVTKQLIDAYEKYGKGAVGVKEVKKEDISKYCSLKTEPIEGNCHLCTDMVEKPKPEEIMGYFSILGRVVMPPEIFSILEHTPKGAGNELQLTDAMKELAKSEGVIAVDYEGKRYDMGNKFGILQANIEVGLRHPEVKEQLKEFLKEITCNEG